MKITGGKDKGKSESDKACSVLPEYGLYQADDLRLGSVNGLVGIVFGHQPDMAAPAAQALDGGFVADPGHHDLTVVGGLLGTHHHFVAG